MHLDGVGLQLHQQVVLGCAPIDSQQLEACLLGVFEHRVQHLLRLQSMETCLRASRLCPFVAMHRPASQVRDFFL